MEASDQPVPTLAEVMEAQATLLDGLMAVELGIWNREMQADRDRARGIINLARAAGVLELKQKQ